ncbi:SLAC1 family transporter [Corynebacterium comes]|uniref:C4-dicarboxylate transporter/malic acid transport protein n=1 Tax=Corynebacterium comes TaxID=2675218 RepID=A0A6B8WC30_9CORY|nr:hypothetical protein [Corynebacterium comes]QGU04388.1 C4-dicarboxylate transporter/malic acid transport protein [Corynebacterium comes]
MPRYPLPPLGPAWAGSVMGTSLAATMTHIHGATFLSPLLLGVASLIFLSVSVGWLQHANPHFTQPYMGPWGMYFMGVLALGAAWTRVTGSWGWQLVTWLVATPFALVICLWQLRQFHGAPTFFWGLSLVPPMVSANSGAQLVESGVLEGHWAGAVWLVAFAGFLLSMVTALPVFARVYLELLRGRLYLPPGLTGTAWIPLGIVGQSTAVAILLSHNPLGNGGGGSREFIGIAVGYVMFALGVPMALYAAWRFWRDILTWPGYYPGWWGSVFPAGTCTLGSYQLAQVTGLGWWNWVSLVWLTVLLFHWSVCALRALAHVHEVNRAG